MEFTIPFNFKPRWYQLDFLKAIDDGIKRIILVWPRRHGKDKACFNALIKEALKTPGNYFYIFPTYAQGKIALWDNLDNDGFRVINHIPDGLIKHKNNTEMKIELINGSTIKIIGAMKVDSIVGSNPRGIVFSEYSLIHPMVLGYLLPIVQNNGGFLWINFTPRGDNHAKELFDEYKDDPSWFVQKLTSKECGVLSEAELEKNRQDYFKIYKDHSLFEQEFNTSFQAPLMGAYFANHISDLNAKGQIRIVSYDPSVPVHTAWDLGIGDATAIWFFQLVGTEIHVIDYVEGSGQGLGYYVNEINSRNYVYGKHYLPHDGNARELQTGMSRKDFLTKLGLNNIEVLELASLESGIEKVRQVLPRCWIDENKCEMGIRALKQYHRKFIEKLKKYADHPEHDWSSHGTDAFRQLAFAVDKIKSTTTRPNIPRHYDSKINFRRSYGIR